MGWIRATGRRRVAGWSAAGAPVDHDLADTGGGAGLVPPVIFHDRLHQAVLGARRRGGRCGVVAATVTGGGSDAVVRLAATAASRLRDSDTATVVDGVVAVLLAEVADESAAVRVADLLREHGEAELGASGSVHAGVALFPDHGAGSEDLWVRARRAVSAAARTDTTTMAYRAALDGDGHDDMLRLAKELRRAVDRRELSCEYQAKMEVVSGAVTGCEALVRWHHPRRGPVAPSSFLPLAEGGGIIEPLTLAVLDRAMARQRSWRRMGLEIRTAVNVGARCLASDTFVPAVAATLARHGLPGAALEVELTEQSLLVDPLGAADRLRALHDLGVSVAVDDFGTGYASLDVVTTLPVDVVKIDQSFVLRMLDDDEAFGVVRFVIDLARAMGLRTVAEGVETEAVASRLRDLGCDAVQGYLVSRPLPGEDFVRWMRARSASAA